MKRIILFLTVCLGLSVSQTTMAADTQTVRTSPQKRTTTNNVSLNTNRTVGSDTKRVENTQTKNTRTATKPTQQKVASRTTTSTQNVKPRTTPQSTKQTTKNIVERNTSARSATQQSRTINARKTNTATTTRAGTHNLSRAAELNATKIESIKAADYSKCKTVYYECMDEFCANKDTNLRRCACSARVHEFDSIKKQLSDAEDKMLDFNQRLLTVSLSKEDAAAINVATEGELAFNIKDATESEKLLQKITKSLNNSGDSKITNDLSAISLSLDMDTAWDDIDSLAGAATTSKNGLDLYNAARPICVEMAKEVCTDDELTIAQDGYKLTIQQDCNTVAKSYDTLYNSAMEKIHESSALLDMSRLNVYQQRNADDTLTCKKKILEQLSDTSVCGENLYKCLDTSGEYINPSTGQAFLSENLYNLTNLLQEPTGDETWSKLSQNEKFVNYLKSKKKFLEPAVEQCRDISDTIWKEFLDDALSQIKLAQNAKLEEIRRSCTTLITECKTNALQDLSEFDSRALSVFSVAADKTVNEMCSDIQNSCIALMNNDTVNSWSSGITGIATDITYDAIIDTCSQIGRDCMVQKCNGTSGNFALCTNITSDNRMAILRRDACWQQVFDCVRGADNLGNMNNLIVTNTGAADTYNDPTGRRLYYFDTYNISGTVAEQDEIYADIPRFCENETGTNLTACLIAEQIWGNCETNPLSGPILNTNAGGGLQHNKILTPKTGSSLLSWLATNTGTTDNPAGCSAYGCPINYQMDTNGTCQLLAQQTTTDGGIAVRRSQVVNVIINALTNFCEHGVRDTFGNCCQSESKSNGICVPDASYKALRLVTTTCNANDTYYCPNHDAGNPRQLSVYCITTNNSIMYDTNTTTYDCVNGNWVLIDQYGNYIQIQNQNGTPAPITTYKPDASTQCRYQYNNNFWKWLNGSVECTEVSDSNDPANYVPVPTNNEFLIGY